MNFKYTTKKVMSSGNLALALTNMDNVEKLSDFQFEKKCQHFNL